MKKESSIVSSINERVWKLRASCNCYFVDLGEQKIIIDTGARADRQHIELFLSKIVPFERVTHVILTHLHSRHAGNLDLFPNARIFAMPEDIADLKNNSSKMISDSLLAEKIGKMDFNSAQSLNIPGIEVIHTPGHTSGSCCILLSDDKVLFTGDTLLENGLGHAHAPTGNIDSLRNSLAKLVDYKFKFICPGH
ncbi:MAG TPA: MBL fold metallo-hydrolase [Candidatus Nanoarchaeia archaeon]|nr:MBL fold metallo-hydrolase [Candidatus Nanoarchaeia archaeon]